MKRNKQIAVLAFGFLMTSNAALAYVHNAATPLTANVATMAGVYISQIELGNQALLNLDMPVKTVKGADNQDTFASGWAKPYLSFEEVDLNSDLTVDRNGMGLFVGANSNLISIGENTDMTYSVYGLYNNASMNYTGLDELKQNSISAGAAVKLMKEGFYLSAASNIGFYESDVYFDKDEEESFYSYAFSAMAKMGYDYDFRLGKIDYKLQPSVLVGYSLISTQDYRNAQRKEIESTAINAWQVVPALRVRSIIENSFSPYFDVKYVESNHTDGRFTINNVALPEFGIQSYFEYGIGFTKQTKGNLFGYGQVSGKSGDVNGVSVQFGFEVQF